MFVCKNPSVLFEKINVFQLSIFIHAGTILGPFTGRKLSIEEARKKHRGTYWEVNL